MILCYGAIFTFFGMQDNNKFRSLIISFLFALIIIIAGLYVYSALQHPEFTTRMVMQEDGSFLRQEGVPNNKYIRGSVRTLYTFIEACIPSTQGLNIARSEGVFNPLAIICQLCVTIATTAAGVALFKKKDIK